MEARVHSVVGSLEPSFKVPVKPSTTSPLNKKADVKKRKNPVKKTVTVSKRPTKGPTTTTTEELPSSSSTPPGGTITSTNNPKKRRAPTKCKSSNIYKQTYQKTKAKLRSLIEEQELLKENFSRRNDELVGLSRDIHIILDKLFSYMDHDRLSSNLDNPTTLLDSKKEEFASGNKNDKIRPSNQAKDKGGGGDKDEESKDKSATSSSDKASSSKSKSSSGRVRKPSPTSPFTSASHPSPKSAKSVKKPNNPPLKPRKKGLTSLKKVQSLPEQDTPSKKGVKVKPHVKVNHQLHPQGMSEPSSPSRITLGSGFYQNSIESPPPISTNNYKKSYSFEESEFCNGSLHFEPNSESCIESELDQHGSFESSSTPSEPFVACDRVKSGLSYVIPDQDLVSIIPDTDTLPDDIFSET